MKVSMKQKIRDLIKSGEITDEDIRDMIGGGTRVQSLRDRCRLVRIKASRFSNSVTDAQVRRELADNKRAKENHLSVSKKLLNRKVLSAVSRPYHASRDLLRVAKNVDEETGVPLNETNCKFGLGKWDGTWTVVPMACLTQLIEEFEKHREAQAQAIKEMEPKWRKIMREAQDSLGLMFDASLLPTYEQFASSWSLELEIVEMPLFDMRVYADRQQRADLAGQIQRHTAQRTAKHLTEMWAGASQTLLNSLNFVTAVLANDPDTVRKMNKSGGERKGKRAVPIGEALFSNLSQQVEMVRDLAEAADDKGLMELAKDAEDTLCTLDPEHLRKNPSERDRAAQAARGLANRAAKQVAATKAETEAAVNELEDFA